MATPAEITSLRQLIDDEDDPPKYTDEYLGAVIDAQGSVNRAAARMWRIAATRYAKLVDVTEGSSSRRLSSMYRQALDLADALEKSDGVDVAVTSRRPARTRAIERA